MTPQNPDQQRQPTGGDSPGSVADELRAESDRLRQLAEKLKAREEALAEMETNYPHLQRFVYAKLREEFERTLGELPDKDLDVIAQEEDAKPLEAFIEELERLDEGPQPCPTI